MKYIKFLNDKAYEAPFETEKSGMKIRGYNRESNERMLLEDGYLKYCGNCALQYLHLENGVIVERPPVVVEELPHRFTKLQIRRCLRKHDLENVLDEVLSANFDFKKDWDDCLNIDFDDEMMQEAISNGIISQELIGLIQSECEEYKEV